MGRRRRSQRVSGGRGEGAPADKEIDKGVLGEVTGYRRSSIDTYLQKLRARELVTVEGRIVRASEMVR